MDKVRLLALSGSLRKVSYNTALLRAIAKLAIDGVDVVLFEDMGHLPLFNPDRENENIPVVKKLRDEIKKSNGLLIASPEYAHGISGVLKNALDWLVSGDEFPNIPIALYNTSPRASHAQAALREVLSTMSGNIIESASISVPLLGTNLDVDGIINNPELSRLIIDNIQLFREKIIEHEKRNANS
jgi:NAD(P)H-dependent FMN reductase